MARNKLKLGDMVCSKSKSLSFVYKFVEYTHNGIVVTTMNGNRQHFKKNSYRLTNSKEIAKAIAKKITDAQQPNDYYAYQVVWDSHVNLK